MKESVLYMLIQFLHPKDTNQTAVRALSQQLQQFFNVTDNRINVGWIHSRTHSDQGFNIRSVKGSERYYLHTGKKQSSLNLIRSMRICCINGFVSPDQWSHH